MHICPGYSIFVIRGNLPECEAEQILGIMRVQQLQRPRLIGEDEAQTSAGCVNVNYCRMYLELWCVCVCV